MAKDADAGEALKRTLGTLVAKQLELLAQLHEIGREMDAIIGGKAGIAAELKQLEAAFETAWCARYAPGEHKAYVWTYTKDRPNMKRLLSRLELAEVVDRVGRYLENEDPYYVRARHAFAVFVASINSHAAPAGQARHEAARESYERLRTECQHSPRCATWEVHKIVLGHEAPL
jgi:hypothetical protein